MPEFGYSFQEFDPAIHVRASGRELNISPKAAREICYTIKGMKLTKAIEYLEKVVKMELPVPYRRYKKKVGHRKEFEGFPSGSYPVKAASAIISVLRNLQNNVEFKGLDPEKVVIIHAAAYPGRVIKDYIPRAFGRSTPNFHQLVHVELVGKEV